MYKLRTRKGERESTIERRYGDIRGVGVGCTYIIAIVAHVKCVWMSVYMLVYLNRYMYEQAAVGK